MKFYKLIPAIIFLIFASCKHSKKEMLLGTWLGTKLENTTIDSFFIKSQHLIDTIGKNNDSVGNVLFYGTSNMDSLRHSLQQQYDSAYLIQTNRVKFTSFQFSKDNIAYISFDNKNNIDTAKWNFDDEGALIFEDLTATGGRAIKRMVILNLNDTSLQLRIWNNNDSSQITFMRVHE